MEASRKVEDGKFCKLVLEEGDLTIVGDFFVHPEDAIDELERIVEAALEEGDSATDAGEVERALQDFQHEEDVDFVGITPAAIAELAVEVSE
jgi:hypothetical protein